MPTVAVERLGRQYVSLPSEFASYAEDVAATCIAASATATVFLPPKVYGNVILHQRITGTIATNPWRTTEVTGRIELGYESLVQTGLSSGKVSSLNVGTLNCETIGTSPQPGEFLSLVYFSGDTGTDAFKNPASPLYKTGAYETSNVADPSNINGWRRCYGELLTVQSYDSVTKTISLAEPLTRLYEVDNSTDRTLKVFNVTTVAPTNVTLDGISIQTPAYGYEAQSFSNVTALTCAQCMNLTLRNVSIRGPRGNGIKVMRCRHVLIENCTVEMAPFHQNGAELYGVNIQQSHYVTLQDHLTIFGRYAVTINQGSSNILVQRLTCYAIHDSGKVADIHGGDCLDITFQDFDLVNRGIAIGNAAFTRGAKNVTVKNFTGGGSTFISCEGSVRDVDISNCQVGYFQSVCLTPDDGNGYNNSTGANHGYTSNLDVSSCTFDFSSTADGAPAVFTWSGSVTGMRLVGYQFTECVFRKRTNATNVICHDRYCVTGSANDVTFSSCSFEWAVNRSKALVALYFGNPNSVAGPVDYLFSKCDFRPFASGPAWVKAYQTMWDTNANFDDCTYTYGSTTYDLDKSLFLDHQLFEVTDESSAQDTTIYANGEEVFSS